MLAEVPDQVRFLFSDITWDESSWQKVMTKVGALDAVGGAIASLAALGVWTTETIEEACRGLVATLDLSVGKVFQPLRVAITGSAVSPPLF